MKKLRKRKLNLFKVLKESWDKYFYFKFQRSIGLNPPLGDGTINPGFFDIFKYTWKLRRDEIKQHNKILAKIRKGTASKEELISFSICTKEGRERLARMMLEPLRKEAARRKLTESA